MMDAASYAVVQDIVRREGRSLLQYVREAYPWTTPEDRAAAEQLNRLIDEEQQGAGALSRLLYRRGLQPPYLGSYPMEFTTINFVSLQHLLPRLIAGECRAVEQLERDQATVTDAEARELVGQILAAKRRHLAELEQMAGSLKEVSTVR